MSLQVTRENDTNERSPPVRFGDPWTPAFGLLGLTGFFDHFQITIAAYEEWFELTPTSA